MVSFELHSLTGIEANDVSALLEQFLEYEEKQGTSWSLNYTWTATLIISWILSFLKIPII